MGEAQQEIQLHVIEKDGQPVAYIESYEEKVEYLSKAVDCDRAVTYLEESKQFWKNKRLCISPTISDIPSSNGISDKPLTLVEKLISIEKDLDEAIDAHIDASNEIKEILEQVREYSNLYDILRYKYLLNMKQKDIAKKMNYSREHISRLHKNAVSLLKIKRERTEDVT